MLSPRYNFFVSRPGNFLRCAPFRLFLNFVTLAFSHTHPLAQSSTPETLGPWHIRHPTPTDYGRGLSHDGRKYVLVDGYGNIYTSIGGWNWTGQSSPLVPSLSSIAY